MEQQNKLATCGGGPGNVNCGEAVDDGEMAVMCDLCQKWFHTLCQDITKGAFTALKKHKGLSWICSVCKLTTHMINSDKAQTQEKWMKSLEVKVKGAEDTLVEKVKDIENALCERMSSLENMLQRYVKESEARSKKMVSDNEIAIVQLLAQAKDVEGIVREQERSTQLLTEKVREDVTRLAKAQSEEKATSGSTNEPQRKAPTSTEEITRILDSCLAKESRKKNLAVFNLPEENAENEQEKRNKDISAFKEMVKEGLKLQVNPIKAYRVGKKTPNRPRILIIAVDDYETKRTILKQKSQLRHTTQWAKVFVNPDLTKQEREAKKKLREGQAARKQSEKEKSVMKKGLHREKTPTRPGPDSATGIEKVGLDKNDEEHNMHNKPEPQKQSDLTSSHAPQPAHGTEHDDTMKKQEAEANLAGPAVVSRAKRNGEAMRAATQQTRT